MKKKQLIFIAIIFIVAFSIIVALNAQNIYSVLSNIKLRSNGNNVYVSEEREINTIISNKDKSVINAEGNKKVTGAYIIENGQVEATEIQGKSVVINKGKEDEKTIEFFQIIKNGEIISVVPSLEGSTMNFSQGKSKIIFTDSGSQSLWIADKYLNNVVNIQPDRVDPYSIQELRDEKKKLEGKGIDIDALILYWVGRPLLSPDEDKIVFQSNRSGYPYNCKETLWVTDMECNTYQIADEENVHSIGWLSNDEILFSNSDFIIKKVSLKDNSITNVFDKPASIHSSGMLSGGEYIFYQNMAGASVDDDLYQYNLTTNESMLINLPDGYKANGTAVFDWHLNKSKVVFYVMNEKTEYKLIVHDCVTGKTNEISVPGNTKFDREIIPKWNNDSIIFSAGGKTHSIDMNNQ